MSALSSPGLIHRSPLVSREDAEERTVGGGFMESYTRPDGRWWSARWEDAFVRCSTLHYPSHVCVGRTTKKSNMTWSTRGFFFLHAECACWLSMPTPNSPAIVGLWTRTQCDGTTAFHVPVFVPRPPSPRIPDPTTIVHCLGSVGSAVSTDQLGIINHGTMVRKSTAHQLACITCWMHHRPSPSPPSPLLPPSLGPRTPRGLSV